ncbi:uncharacterized protein LOC143424748 [Xylocopa sonorina]|uniref:uncharacterized protein LOC143424748 n=1 Tax=Xylocopa sonorina TaxID=1818115 RepID=UPI00403AD98B
MNIFNSHVIHVVQPRVSPEGKTYLSVVNVDGTPCTPLCTVFLCQKCVRKYVEKMMESRIPYSVRSSRATFAVVERTRAMHGTAVRKRSAWNSIVFFLTDRRGCRREI